MQAQSGGGCSEAMEQIAVHVAGECDEVPADADKNYPHCHADCHGHHVAVQLPSSAAARLFAIHGLYASTLAVLLIAHRHAQTLRPPQA